MTAPTQPDYNTTPSPTGGPTTGISSTDIWGLGNLYGKHVALGMTPGTAPHAPTAADIRFRHANPDDTATNAEHPGTVKWGTTQDVLTKYKDLWATGTAGNKPKNQQALQTYEQLQLMLLQAGAYATGTSIKTLRFGQWTDQTENAIVTALNGYEQNLDPHTPITFEDYLQQNRDGGSLNGKSTADPAGLAGAGTTAPTTQLTDPASLRASAMTAAQAALGVGMSDDQLNKFVAQFQGAEAAAQNIANQPAGGGTVIRPDQVADANAFAQKSDPQGYSNHQAQGYMNALMNLFLPSQDARSNIQPVASA
jgi:hypothetical protein